MLTIFLFAFAGVFYFEARGVARTPIVRRNVLVRRGDTIFVVSLLVGTGMPALILYTLDIVIVGIVATILWALYATFIIQQGRNLRSL